MTLRSRNDSLDRQARIRGSDRQSRGQPSRSSVQAASGSKIDFAVIRSIDKVANTMMVQRFDYKDTPPVVTAYETLGDEVEAYPLPTHTAAHYENFVWPATDEEGEPNPISIKTVPVILTKNSKGDLIVMVAFKIDGALLPEDEERNECNFG